MNVLLKKQKGLNIIELMIAMTLGLILSAGAIQIFISTKTTNKVENALSRLQETGRYVIDVMAKDIRMAGYNGCSSRGAIDVNVIAKAPLPITLDGSDAIRGYNGSSTVWAPVIDSNLNITGATANTDVLNIQRADACGAHVAGNFLPDNANVQVASPNGCGFAKDQAVLITDCVGADLYQITNTVSSSGGTETTAHSTSTNTDNKLSKSYGPDSQIFRLKSTAYYIGTGASGEPALFQSSWDPTADNAITGADFDAVELIDGVEDMQILYGVDTGGDEYANTYVTANSVTNWENVRSVRINLLLRSEDGIISVPRTTTFNGATVGGSDTRLRLVFSSTTTVRNRLP